MGNFLFSQTTTPFKRARLTRNAYQLYENSGRKGLCLRCVSYVSRWASTTGTGSWVVEWAEVLLVTSTPPFEHWAVSICGKQKEVFQATNKLSRWLLAFRANVKRASTPECTRALLSYMMFNLGMLLDSVWVCIGECVVVVVVTRCRYPLPMLMLMLIWLTTDTKSHSYTHTRSHTCAHIQWHLRIFYVATQKHLPPNVAVNLVTWEHQPFPHADFNIFACMCTYKTTGRTMCISCKCLRSIWKDSQWDK